MATTVHAVLKLLWDYGHSSGKQAIFVETAKFRHKTNKILELNQARLCCLIEYRGLIKQETTQCCYKSMEGGQSSTVMQAARLSLTRAEERVDRLQDVVRGDVVVFDQQHGGLSLHPGSLHGGLENRLELS